MISLASTPAFAGIGGNEEAARIILADADRYSACRSSGPGCGWNAVETGGKSRGPR
jgi:hypothetical protein